MPENPNIKIEKVNDNTITVNVNGQVVELPKNLNALIEFLQKQQSQTFQTADKIYNIESIGEANFNFIIQQITADKQLPEQLANDLFTDDTIWVESLKRELLKRQVSVQDKPSAIFQHYGWLVEVFLQKMQTKVGKKRTLRRLSFMAEAFQSSLRYLCYIQLAQLLVNKQHNTQKITQKLMTDFFKNSESDFTTFDWLNLLISTNNLLSNSENFVSEIPAFVNKLEDDQHSSLRAVALFLQSKRLQLLKGEIAEDAYLNQLLDEYLTALAYWLRKIAFLAKYRLASIKDINLNYRLGSAKNFVHIYGELHGWYSKVYQDDFDYQQQSITNFFTFNKSVLLFKGSNISTSLENMEAADNFLSLSPLIIDQSVFTQKETQTPEIYYYTHKSKASLHFAYYKNELNYNDEAAIESNKSIEVKMQNNQQPKLDDLFEQFEQVLEPANTTLL